MIKSAPAQMLTMVILAIAGVFLIPYGAQAADEMNNIIGLMGIGGVGSCSATDFTTPCSDNPKDGLFASIACRVMKSFNSGVIPIYCKMITNPTYLAIISAAMALYVIILGVSFIFGLVPMKLGPFMGRLIKIAFVFAIITNADFYFAMIYSTALSLPQEIVFVIINSGAEAGSGSNDFFDYVDKGIFEVFNEVIYPEITDGSGATYRKADLKILLAGIALWQLGGDMVGGLFFAVIFGWILAYFSIMIRYLLAMMSMMFLLMLGPIFIPTLLFDKIKYLGEDWIRMIISFIIQIVLIVAFIVMTQGFFVEFYNTVKETMNATVMKQSTEKYTVPYGDDAYSITERVKYTPQAANNFMAGMFKSSSTTGADDKLPEIVVRLLKMMVIIYLTFLFMRNVPQLSVLLGGNPRFPQLFAGINAGVIAGAHSSARLFSQNQMGPGKGPAFDKMFGSIVRGR